MASWLREVEGTYGSEKTPCTVYVYETLNGRWYACDGSVNCNFTYDDIEDGVDVEELSDVDFFTASKPIESCDQLEEEADEL